MVTKGIVYYNGEAAGILEKENARYRFTYLPAYLDRQRSRPVSITLPKQEAPYYSEQLFPFFANLLSEGANKRLQCMKWKIDERDYFRLLLQTSGEETIGPVTVKPIEDGTNT